ncbi:MAG: helix-turn-helix transcriptional regulator [Pseudomonadota bacterium]
MRDQKTISDLTPNAAKVRKLALGAILKAKREASGLTQAQLSKNIGSDYVTGVSQIENGVGRIPHHLLGPWADQLGIPRHDFALIVLSHIEPGLMDLLDPDQTIRPLDGENQQLLYRSS